MNNIKSMTGYGKVSKSNDLHCITVEIKSLNSKQLDLNSRIAYIYREYEFAIRALVSKALLRGKVELNISVENLHTMAATQINKELFNEYKSQIESLGFDTSSSDLLSTIMRLPDVVSTPKVEISESEKDMLFETIELALCEYNKFRADEGKIMMNDILLHINQIENYLTLVDEHEGARLESVKGRMFEHIEKMNIAVDKNRFEQELMYYIEKFDITEEKVRLKKHIEYFREVCKGDEGVGKKLGFVTQEIGREINTLGSKSYNYNLQQIVINMKDELEKIKEQLLNIL